MQKKSPKPKILAIGAHSNDIEFYAGGTLLSLSKTHDIYFLVATSGQFGTHSSHHHSEQLAHLRKQEQSHSAKIIGAKSVHYLDFIDGDLEFHTQLLKQKLLQIITSLSPQIIFTFDPHHQHMLHHDFHPDHRTLAHAALDVILIDSTLPLKGGTSNYHPTIYLYNAYKPNKKIDISKYVHQKALSLAQFDTQKDVLQKQSPLLRPYEEFLVWQNP